MSILGTFLSDFLVQIIVSVGGCTAALVIVLLSLGAMVAFQNSTDVIRDLNLAARVALVCLNMVLCTFLLVSSIVGLVLLKRAGVSKENFLGLQKLLGVAAALFVATIFRSTTRIMTWYAGWWLPEWFEHGLGNLLFYTVTFGALLFFIFSAMRAKHISVHGGAVEMSQKLLSDESSELEDNVPKAYLI